MDTTNQSNNQMLSLRPSKLVSVPYVICVEGNIGSGKSTLLKNLSQQGYNVISEPVDAIWGQYLPLLYQDLKRWGFCFEVEVIDWFRQLYIHNFTFIDHRFHKLNVKEQHFHNHNNNNDFDNISSSSSLSLSLSTSIYDDRQYSIEEKNDDITITPLNDITNTENKRKREKKNKKKQDIIIIERSALSAFEIFSKNLFENNNMTKWELSLLQRIYDNIEWQPAFIMYLRCDYDISCLRIRKRNRDGEDKVDEQLIQQLHHKHETLFCNHHNKHNNHNNNNNNNNNEKQFPQIIIINGNQNAYDVTNDAIEQLNQIEQSMMQE
jgi:deoxyadenosine/deoxycytidine kinase